MRKSLVVLGDNGCWNGLLRFFDDVQELGFADVAPLFVVCEGAETALDSVESAASEPAPITLRSSTLAGI